MTAGTGHAPCHHGELLQGVFLDPAGRTRRGLVTLPMAGPGSRATFRRRSGEPLTVSPAGRTKALRAAALAVDECARLTGRPADGGVLRLDSGVPVGLGMGSSTSDVLATVRAVAASYGVVLAPETIARLAVRAEQACDPLMLGGRPLLFAQREGHVLEELGATLPPMVVVGCLTGDGGPVDTLGLARDGEADVRAFERLRGLLRRAIADADVGLLGRVSTHSARHNQRLLPKAEFPVLERVAERTGAAGVQVAHSGNVAGLLFDARSAGLARDLRRCVRALRRCDIPVTRIFRTQPSGGRAWTATSPRPSAGRIWCASGRVSSVSASRP